MEAINAIGKVALTSECKALIDAARAAYDDLTDEQKALIDNYATLTDAEAAYKALEPGQGGDTAVSNTVVSEKATKCIVNGQLLIKKNDVIYNVLGTIVK